MSKNKIKIGDKAPDFTLKDLNGENWSLHEYEGKTVVLLFYPGDDAPVCTAQLCSVRDNWSQYKETGAEVVGISMDSEASHKSFADKYNLTLRLLSDRKGTVVNDYGMKSWFAGSSVRGVVIIDKNSKIAFHKVYSFRIFRPKDEDILATIRQVNYL